MKNKLYNIIILAIILAMCLILVSCELTPSSEICVSIPPQAYLVKRITGEATGVTIMIPPGSAPPTYAPTASQVRALHECKLYVKNGHPDFHFEQKHINPYLKEHPEVLTVSMAENMDILPGDAHLWLSPRYMQVAAKRIYDQLIIIYPEREAEFREKLITLINDIQTLDSELKTELKDLRGKEFLTLHPSWGYFSRDYGVEQVSIRHEHKAPSTQELAHLIEHAKEHDIHVIFVQKEFSSEQLNVISKEIDATVIALDPLNENWLENMRHTGKILQKALNEH
jgi:zinc transport system substrate-binding protein